MWVQYLFRVCAPCQMLITLPKSTLSTNAYEYHRCLSGVMAIKHAYAQMLITFRPLSMLAFYEINYLSPITTTTKSGLPPSRRREGMWWLLIDHTNVRTLGFLSVSGNSDMWMFEAPRWMVKNARHLNTDVCACFVTRRWRCRDFLFQY